MDEPKTWSPAWNAARAGQENGGGGRGWRFERSVNLGTVLSLLTSLAVVVGLAAGIKTRLEVVEERLCRLEVRIDEARATAVKVERIEERVRFVQETLGDLREDLRRKRRG